MKKYGLPLVIVLVIEKYFALPFTLLFGNPNIFWGASSSIWPAIWHMATQLFYTL